MVVSLNFKSILTKQNAAFILVALVAVLLAIIFRTSMLHLYGFYEPDGFYYYTAMRAIVNNNFVIPAQLGISGWPQHVRIAEAHGIYWLVLLPYIILRYFGVTYYTIMRIIPVVFGLLDMLGAYMLSRYLSKDKALGALTLFFVALSMGNAARTSALVFRGDSFVTFFLLVALILFIEVFRQEKESRKIIFSVAAGVALLICNLVWNGAVFADIAFILSFILLMAGAFVFRKDRVISDGKYLLVSILVWYALAMTVESTGFIPGQQLLDASFIPIYAVIVIFWAFVYLISTRMIDLVRTFAYRLGILLAVMFIGAAVFVLVQPATINSLFVGNGFVITSNSFASTTEELQPPTFQFLFTSFGVNLFTSLPTLFMAASSYFGFAGTPTTPGVWVSFYGFVGVLFTIILFLPYLFMQVYDSSGFLGGKPKLRFDLNIPILVMTSYFILTAYPEMHVIRYNALVSVPIAIMAAYSIYLAMLFAKNMANHAPARHHLTHKLLPSIVIGFVALLVWYAFGSIISSVGYVGPLLGILFGIAFAAMAYIILNKERIRSAVFLVATLLLVFLLFLIIIQVSQNQIGQLLADYGTAGLLLAIVFLSALVILAIGTAASIYYCYASFHRDIDDGRYALLIYLASAAILAYLFYSLLFFAYVYSSTLTQADSINTQFIGAMQWLNQNSPSNSVVLTLWPDGSVVEAVANRTTVMDSVGSENGSKATPFAAWLFNDSPDGQFLETPTLMGYPNYLVVRMPWLIETQGIYTEANISSNVSLYGYSPLPSFSESAPNATSRQLVMTINGGSSYPYVVVNVQYSNTTQAASQVTAYLDISSTQQVPFTAVAFEDQNGNYSYITQGPSNTTNGELLVVQYSTAPRSGFFLNVTGAYVFAPGIANSNMVKFLFLCGPTQCSWDNNQATANLVYINSDTKIFRITYNSTT